MSSSASGDFPWSTGQRQLHTREATVERRQREKKKKNRNRRIKWEKRERLRGDESRLRGNQGRRWRKRDE